MLAHFDNRSKPSYDILRLQTVYVFKMVALTKMMVVLFLMSYVVLKRTFTIPSAFFCTQMCYCFRPTVRNIEPYHRNNTLMVDCGERDVDKGVLTKELDLLLSDDDIKENLIWLTLNATPLTQVPMSVCRLYNLRWLFLDNNELGRLPGNCFTNMTALLHLGAENNSITELQHGVFDGVTSLTGLYLANNTIVSMSIRQLPNLEWLNLDNNRLRRLPDNCFTNMTRFYGLSVVNNRITELQDGLFGGLNSLTYLHLANNRIASIGLRLFSNPSDLVNLTVIQLNHNRLRSLGPWPYIRGLHGSPDSKVYIELQHNLISKFTNNIGWQFNCTRFSYAIVHLVSNYIRHIADIANGWNFTLEQWLCFRHSSYDYSNQVTYNAFSVDYAYSYDYHCDCRDVNYLAILRSGVISVNFAYFNHIRCSQPLSLANRTVSDISLNEFVCELYNRCPPSCRCVNRPENFTVHVYCSATNLSSLPLDVPPLPFKGYTYKLDFSNNKLIRRLENRPYLVNTSVLDISDCAIEVVDLNAWRAFAMMPSEHFNLEKIVMASFDNGNGILPSSYVDDPVVFLHGNKIESVSFDVTDINLTSAHLTLNDNPWKCSCDNRWIIAWFKSLSSGASSNVRDVLCDSPSRLHGRSILQSDEVEFCVDPTMKMLKIVLSSTLSVVAGLLMLGFAVYRVRVRLYKRWKLSLIHI